MRCLRKSKWADSFASDFNQKRTNENVQIYLRNQDTNEDLTLDFINRALLELSKLEERAKLKIRE